MCSLNDSLVSASTNSTVKFPTFTILLYVVSCARLLLEVDLWMEGFVTSPPMCAMSECISCFGTGTENLRVTNA